MHLEDEIVKVGVRKRGPGTEDAVLIGSFQRSGVQTQKTVRKIYCLPDVCRPYCFPDTSTKSSVCILPCSAMTMKLTGKEFYHFLLPCFFPADHYAAPRFISHFSDINPSAKLALSVLGFRYEETNYFGKFNNDHHAPFYWLILSFCSHRLLYLPKVKLLTYFPKATTWASMVL